MNNYTQSKFSAGQVAFIASISPAQVAQIGQFIAASAPANGKGYRIGYSFRNVVEVFISLHLIQFGVPRKRIRQYLDNLGRSRMGWLDRDGHDGWIIIDPQWRWAAGTTCDDAIAGLATDRPLSLVAIDVGKIKNTVTNKIQELGDHNGVVPAVV